ncbi:hypothetical protein AVEN_63188-1, partial [Araneus ventricosus]
MSRFEGDSPGFVPVSSSTSSGRPNVPFSEREEHTITISSKKRPKTPTVMSTIQAMMEHALYVSHL